MSWALFSGFSKVSTVPLGSFAKAASVGAKTVNGPSPFRVSTRPATFNAAVSVLNEPLADATSTRVFVSTFLAAGSTELLRGAIVGIGVGAIVGIGMGVTGDVSDTSISAALTVVIPAIVVAVKMPASPNK